MLANSKHDVAPHLDAAIEAFVTPLRMGEGVDEPAYLELVQALKEVAIQWHDQDSIPKSVAILLIELYPALAGTVALYKGSEAERIRELCERLLDLSITCSKEGHL